MDKGLFMIIAVVGSISNLLGFVATYLIYGMNSDTIAVGICLSGYIIVSVTGFLSKDYKPAMKGLLTIFCILECPFLILVYGASTICYGMLGAVATVLYIRKKKGSIFIAVSFVLDTLALVMHYCYEPLSLKYGIDEKIPAIITTFVICFFTIMCITNIFVYGYRLQNIMLEDLSKQLAHNANTDPLTGIHNRRYLMNYLDKNRRSSEVWCAMIVDIDFFKRVNDTYGHIFGDEVLKEFADIMTRKLGDYGEPTRFGGEEFMIIFHTDDNNIIHCIMDEIKKELSEFSMREKGIDITFSGGAQFFDKTMEISDIFTGADKKLYKAKESGRNCIVY